MLWFDIALRNILLAHDWTIRAIDFANSTAAPLDADLDATVWDGYTSKVEVLHVANIIYSISRWEKFQTDCVHEDEWPAIDIFPATRDLVLGQIISQAWQRQYSNIIELRHALWSSRNEEESNSTNYTRKNHILIEIFVFEFKSDLM